MAALLRGGDRRDHKLAMKDPGQAQDTTLDPRLKLAFVVTEFPKTTETFILRDIMALHQMGCDVRVFHLTRFNTKDILHEFAAPTLAWAQGYAYVASWDVGAAVGHFIWHQPRVLASILRDIVKGCRRDPVMLLKSLFILPKSLRIARALMDWKCAHVHAAYAGHPATTGWVVQRVTGIPFSCSSHAHDLFETQALLAEKLPEASFVRTISDFNRKFILDHIPALVSRPPVVIHVGIDPSASQKTPRLVRTQDHLGRFEILYVGSLERRKGVDVLLTALASVTIKDWHLNVIGAGPEAAALKAQVARLGLEEKVSFHGGQSNTAVQQAMATASVLVVPSRIGPRNQTEGLPTVIVEAFSMGLPVIAARLTGIPEIVRDGETGFLFEMEDVGGLKDALQAVYRAPDHAQRLAAQGRALVHQEFNQPVNARKLLDLIVACSQPASHGTAP
jgi:colanic acid/amylovoran biosynthesis glycosyltransferase